MKYYRALRVFIAQFIFISIAMTTLLAQVDLLEKDMGIPFYPGSRLIPGTGPLETDKNPQSFLNISFITSDNFKKVLSFYQEKLGKFSIFKSQSLTKSAMWNESTHKGYRIVTLVETEDGTKITITKRVWSLVDKTSHQKSF